MKWYQTLCIACGIALFAPSIASAQPVPAHHGSAASNAKGNSHHDKKHDKDKDKDKKDEKKGHGSNHKPDVVKPVRPDFHPAAPAQPSHRPAPAHPSHPVPGPAAPAHPVPTHDPMIHGMHPHEFEHLVHSVKHSNFKADKVNLIKVAARSNRFTSDQVKILMDSLAFDNDRVEVACTLYPHVVDRQNWFKIFDSLKFSSSRHRIEACSR